MGGPPPFLGEKPLLPVADGAASAPPAAAPAEPAEEALVLFIGNLTQSATSVLLTELLRQVRDAWRLAPPPAPPPL